MMKVSLIISIYFVSRFYLSKVLALEKKEEYITYSSKKGLVRDKETDRILQSLTPKNHIHRSRKGGKKGKSGSGWEKGKGKGAILFCDELSNVPSSSPSMSSIPSITPSVFLPSSKGGKGGKGKGKKSNKGYNKGKGKGKTSKNGYNKGKGKKRCIERTIVPSTSFHPSASFSPSQSLQPSQMPSVSSALSLLLQSSPPSETPLPTISPDDDSARGTDIGNSNSFSDPQLITSHYVGESNSIQKSDATNLFITVERVVFIITTMVFCVVV